MADGKPGTIDAASQIIVLAFDLVDKTLPATPTILANALQSAQVQNAITKTLFDYAASKAKKGSAAIDSPEEGRKLLEAMGEGVVDAATEDVLKQIKKTQQYKALEASVVTFRKTVESSPLGVWVDKNKGILYVVGVGLIAGTAGALYYTKTGGTVVNKVVDPLKGRKFEVLQIGTLSFGAALWDFKPDARVLGAKVITAKTWSTFSVELKLGLLAEGAAVQQVEGSALVKSGAFSVNVTGNAKPQTQQVNLGLKLDYAGVIDNGTFNIGIGAMYQDNQGSGTLGASYKSGPAKFGLEGNIGPKDGGGVQYGGLLTLSVDL